MARTLLSRRVVAEAVTHVVDGLIEASLRGVDSHGVHLFPLYMRELDAGRINRQPTMAWHQTKAAGALLDADAGFGHHSGCVAMDRAIAMAIKSGVAFVGVINSNHFGAAACFTLRAARKGLIGFAFTNTDPLMRAFGSTEAFCGTNPICVAAPIASEDPFCLDMATTKVTWNAVGLARESRRPLAAGIAFDQNGQPTLDPEAAEMLAPIGDYKGYGLGLCIEILCGALNGGTFSSEVSEMFGEAKPGRRNICHFLGALDPDAFCGNRLFADRMVSLARQVRALRPESSSTAMLLPGEREGDIQRQREISGIPISLSRWESFLSLDPDFVTAVMTS